MDFCAQVNEWTKNTDVAESLKKKKKVTIYGKL